MNEGHFNESFTRSGRAVSDITGLRAVKHATTGTEDIAFDVAGAGQEAAGIAIGNALTGESVGVAPLGFGLAEVDGSGSAIAAGDKLVAGANGVLVKAGVGAVYIAEAWEPATAANIVIRVFIQKGRTAAA